MKAITYQRYGGPEVLQLSERPKPTPGDDETLVRICATSINAADYRMMRADPFLVRLANGLLSPRNQVLGIDFAGIVELVGSNVRGLEVGDEVFGHSFRAGGGFAEYVCVPAAGVALKPATLDFEQAASVVLAGITALQAVRDRAAVRPGQSVLIQGAGGGVGTLMVQIAKAYGAHVTAVCGPGSIELVTSLGADRVIDYTSRDDIGDTRYDATFGINGHRPLATYRDSLKPGGTYVVVGGESRQLFEAMCLGALRFAGSGRKIQILSLDADRKAGDLQELHTLITAGKIQPIIDRILPLAETPAAIRYVEQGHVRGKVVLQVAAA